MFKNFTNMKTFNINKICLVIISYLPWWKNLFRILDPKSVLLLLHATSSKKIWNLRSRPPMYFIVISQCPQTALTIGYNFLPLRPLNATPRYWPSTTKLNVPSSMSKTTRNLSGTINVSSGFNSAGYVTPALFFASWYSLFRPTRKQKQHIEI